MNAPFPSLLAELAHRGVRLKLVGPDQLEVSAPRGGLTDGLRERILERRAELLAWLARDGITHHADVPPGNNGVASTDPETQYEPFALSDLQKSFLIGSREGFEHHVRPHQYMEFELGDVDASRFEAALNQALHRQRANLVVLRDDLRLQAVRDPDPVRVRVRDLRHLDEAGMRAGLARVRAAMRRQELPLDRWPWLDVAITRYGDGRNRLHYNNNNFFSDAMGTFRLLDTTQRCYGRPAERLPSLPLTFRECVLALAERESTPEGRAAQRYWLDRIPDLPSAPELPRTNADTRRRSRLRRRELVVPADQWTQVKARAAERGITPTMVACGAHAEMLAYWSGSRHFLLNNMISHRADLDPRAADVIGNLAALYPLEVDWRHVETFGERVRRLQSQVVADMEHTQWGSVEVLQALNRTRRSPGRAACPYAVGSALFLGPVDRPAYSLLETPQVSFDCEFWEQRDRSLWVVWDVIEEMFPPGLIDAMKEGYQRMLTTLVAESGWDAPAPDLLPAAQRRQRSRLNRPARTVPDGLLHDGLTTSARTGPAKAAVVTAEMTLSYAELQRRSDALARRLRAAGVQPGECVALVLRKGWAQVVAVLATLGAGAAYVPIDPDWPLARVRELVGETSARVALTSSDLAAGLNEAGAALLILDVGQPSTVEAVGSCRPEAARPDDLAYVIFTSGSTGRPKGVALDHRGPLNTITDVNRRFGVTDHDLVFGLSSLCFDLSVYDIFGTIAAGATLVLPSPSDGPTEWVGQIRDAGVTVCSCVPALMQLIVETAVATGVGLPSLRTVLLSGDWIPVRLPAQIRAVAPQARIISLGGATEASIWSICYPIGPVDPAWPSIPYGRPMTNQSWHVLDGLGRDAPVWTTGELYIGGVGVATGYLGDPERTARAFVAHPRTGERLYGTGDLGRYLPTGDIEFLGRADRQLKIQGYRVEPGEVEHVLASCPGVRHVSVVARTSPAGRQLAAFVVADNGFDPERARSFVADRLPPYLVPSTISRLDRMPLGANGKLDRRALEGLPANGVGPAVDRAADGAPDGAPDTWTELETALARIWQEVLGCDQIDRHDDFFALGGQSFAALRVLSLVAARLGRTAPVGALLERPSLAGFAASLASSGKAPLSSPLVRLREAAEGPPWVVVHPAGGNVVCYRLLAGLVDRGLWALQAPGTSSGGPALSDVGAFADRYIAALREAQHRGPYLLGGWSSGAVIAVELAHRLERLGERVDRLAVLDSPAPVAPRSIKDSDIALWFLEDLDIGFDRTLVGRSEAERLLHVRRSQLWSEVVRLARAQGLAIERVAGLSTALAVFSDVVAACHAYRAPTIAADVTLVRAATGAVAEFATHPLSGDADWGWSAVTTGRVHTTTVPGSHHTMLTSPWVNAVAEAMARS